MVFYIILGILALFFILYILSVFPGKLPKNSSPKLWGIKVAHRGLHNKEKTVPENSLTAFRLAAEAGYGIELDLNITKDGQVVVFHDDDLKRVCGVDKRINDCTYEELQQYRLCGTEEKIPLFSQVLALVNCRVSFIVEIKTTPRYRELCTLALKMLREYKGLYCIESFHPAIVLWFKKNAPDIVRGQLASGMNDYGALPKYQGFLLSSLMTNVLTRPHFVAYNHKFAHHNFSLWLYKLFGGKKVAWTVRDSDDISWCDSHFDTIIFEFYRP